MDTNILEDLGLSKGEIKVYLTLLELGKTKVGQIIEKSGLASSAVHGAIHSLTDKGLISFIKDGKIKLYLAAKPEQLMNFIEEKKNKLKTILPELESKQSLSIEKQEAQVFQGLKGVSTMLNGLIGSAKKGDEYLFFAIDIESQNKEIQEFFEKYDAKRKDKGLKVRGLAPTELKPFFEKRKILKMKYPNGPLPTGISICDEKIAIYSWAEKPIGYLISSKQISEMYRNYFQSLWDSI